MKNMKLIGCHLAAVIVFSGLFFSCSQTHVVKEYVDYVNVFIGTGGHGHTYPGATLPHGMVQLSPDTRLFGWDGCSGYYYADSSIIGFSPEKINLWYQEMRKILTQAIVLVFLIKKKRLFRDITKFGCPIMILPLS